VGKKKAEKESTIENRVYLFKDLAAAFAASQGQALTSGDPGTRARALRALGDLAYASCVVADTGHLEAGEVGELVAKGAPTPPPPAPAPRPRARKSKKASQKRSGGKKKKKAGKKRKGSGRKGWGSGGTAVR